MIHFCANFPRAEWPIFTRIVAIPPLGGGMSTALGGGMSTALGGGLSTALGGGLSTALGGGLSTALGGGLSTAVGGGLSTAPGGGMYTGAGVGPSGKRYHSNQPPKHILIRELQKRGMTQYVEILKRAGIT